MSRRVERMFGPREEWGKGDEMGRVKAQAAAGGCRYGHDKAAPSYSAEGYSGSGKGSGMTKAQVQAAVKAIDAKIAGDSGGPGGRKAAGFNRGGAPWGGLAGFVSIRCEGCGKVANTCLHERRPAFRCNGCGHETSLEKVSNIHMKCARCGFTGKYRTNRVEEKIQMECLNCSDIVYLTRIRRGNYVPEVEAGEGGVTDDH